MEYLHDSLDPSLSWNNSWDEIMILDFYAILENELDMIGERMSKSWEGFQ